METYSAIKRFVRETLGCSCPEEVFEKIEYQTGGDDISGSKINVGDRLLIYLIVVDREAGIQRLINSALEQGIMERDSKGLNRFRLVLVASEPDVLRGPAELAFGNSRCADGKTHLHIVRESDVEGF